MNSNYYCDIVQSELTGLKARAYDLIRHNRDQLTPEFEEVHALVDDLNVTIDNLKRRCPSEFSSEMSEIERKKIKLLAKMNKWDKDHIAGGYVGG